MSAHPTLTKLLSSLFDADELRRFLQQDPDLSAIVDFLPDKVAPKAELIAGLLNQLDSRGLITIEFFERLLLVRPSRADDIIATRNWLFPPFVQQSSSPEGGANDTHCEQGDQSLIDSDPLLSAIHRLSKGSFTISALILTIGFDVLCVLWFAAFKQSSLAADLPGLFDYKSAAIGDSILLPAAGAFALRALQALSEYCRMARIDIPNHLLKVCSVLAPTLSVLLTLGIHIAWLTDPNTTLNWTIPQPHTLNVAGWWHAFYFAILLWFFLSAMSRIAIGLTVAARQQIYAFGNRAGAAARFSACWQNLTGCLVLLVCFAVLLSLDNVAVGDTHAMGSLASTVATVSAVAAAFVLGQLQMFRAYARLSLPEHLVELQRRLLAFLLASTIMVAVGAWLLTNWCAPLAQLWHSFAHPQMLLGAGIVLLSSSSIVANVYVLHRRGDALNIALLAGVAVSIATIANGLGEAGAWKLSQMSSFGLSEAVPYALLAFFAPSSGAFLLICVGMAIDGAERAICESRFRPTHLTDMPPLYNIIQDQTGFLLLQVLGLELCTLLVGRFALNRGEANELLFLLLIAAIYLFCLFIGTGMTFFNSYAHLRDLAGRLHGRVASVGFAGEVRTIYLWVVFIVALSCSITATLAGWTIYSALAAWRP